MAETSGGGCGSPTAGRRTQAANRPPLIPKAFVFTFAGPQIGRPDRAAPVPLDGALANQFAFKMIGRRRRPPADHLSTPAFARYRACIEAT
jgi:hypothetical protein